jgi:hypothetical protein
VFNLANPAEFKSQMEAAGFHEVAVNFTAREVSVANFDQLWGMLTTGAPPVQVLLNQIGADQHSRIQRALSYD